MNLIIDATNLLTRSYHALPENENRTWAIFGFANMMLDTIKRWNPTQLHFCFDDTQNWRKALYPDYKANRERKEDFLAYQLKLAYTTMKRLGLSVYCHPMAEADDLIATLCQQLPGKKYILSSDKDLMQLIDRDVIFIRFTQKFSIQEQITAESFFNKWCFEPRLWSSYQALVGETGDNIKGVKGVGPKNALPLVQKYGSLENMLDRHEPDLVKVLADTENARKCLKLTTLVNVVGLDVQSGQYDKNLIHKLADIVRG